MSVIKTFFAMQLKGFSTPVQREAAAVKLTLIDFMVSMYKVYVDETREQQIQNLRKGSVLRVRSSDQFLMCFTITFFYPGCGRLNKRRAQPYRSREIVVDEHRVRSCCKF
jgi:hypothetical protein